ncbi:MAG: CinA family protein [Fusobacteriaceae bacterium]
MEKKGKKLYNGVNEFNLIKILNEKNIKISVAESCTGGMLSEKITAIPGASKVFYEGVVTYSNASKISRLGVKSETIEKYGAVSRETALEMLKGLTTEIGISITGFAGPGGGDETNPVGTVFIGIKKESQIEVFHYIFSGDREEIRKSCVERALIEVIKLLK